MNAINASVDHPFKCANEVVISSRRRKRFPTSGANVLIFVKVSSVSDDVAVVAAAVDVSVAY